MSDVTALFWDVGGVILSNGWDRAARAAAAKKFGLDWEEFEDRHDLASPAFETGRITLDTYLQRTVFYRKRSFTRKNSPISFSRSRRNFRNRARFLSDVAATGKYLLATINNEAARTERTQDPAVSICGANSRRFSAPAIWASESPMRESISWRLK